jgi:hypothetical protein
VWIGYNASREDSRRQVWRWIGGKREFITVGSLSQQISTADGCLRLLENTQFFRECAPCELVVIIEKFDKPAPGLP